MTCYIYEKYIRRFPEYCELLFAFNYNYTTNINKPIEQKDSGKVGSKTRQFIEESKQELEEYKEQMRGK